MSEPKLVSPLLDGFMMGEPITDRDGVRCCPAMKENSDDKYIVKIISIPASQKQLDALLLTGAYKDSEAAAEYFKSLAEDTVKEARLLQQLAKLEGFLSYEGWQIVPMEKGETGFDVYLLGSYKRSLDKFLRRNPMTHLGAVNLGIDLCAALSLCRRAGFIYTDLKPTNIFITGKQEYRIGDLGFVKLSAMKYTSLPRQHISRYTPPELHDPLVTLNPTVDIYAVGMVLYQIFNNGELPFQSKAPMRILPAPLNADYEMAEIILKACHPNPRKRYQTPIEMGQALVSYMQRNSVNDTPLVPPTVETSPAAAAAEEIPNAAETAIPQAPAEAPEELQFMEELVSDETAPDTAAGDDLVDAETTDEVEQILAEADALMEQSEVIFTEPEQAEEAEDTEALPEAEEAPTAEAADAAPEAEDAHEAEETAAAEDAAENVPEEAAADSTEEAEAEVSTEDDGEDEYSGDDLDFDLSEIDAILPDTDEDLDFDLPQTLSEMDEDEEDFFDEIAAPRKKRSWIGIVVAVLVLALLGGGAYYYFANLYTLHIESMAIDGFQNALTVSVSTEADTGKLKIVCTDTYGNRQELPLSDGKAEFTDLAPETMYKITVEAEGFHRVTGSVSGTYTTAEQTSVVDFSAKTGMEDGSVILNFTVDGPEPQEWIVEYTAEGEETQSVSFTGHMVTVNDLSIGKHYTFTLVVPENSELYLSGTTTVEYLASEIVLARNLTIVSCEDGVLSAQWTGPETEQVWNVRCYSNEGYDEIITVTDTAARFEGISADQAYTVEVTAEGMSQSAQAYVTANPVTVTDVQVSYNKETGMTVTWNADRTPTGGWLVMYHLDASETAEMAECTGTTATVKTVIPNAAYSFQIKAADGSTVFGGSASHDGIEATTFNQHGLRADQLLISLCRTPDKENWTHEDVKNDYTTSFASGEKASLVLYSTVYFGLEAEDTTITFVIRNANGDVIPSYTRTLTKVWKEMWPGHGIYCYLDIPVLPTVEGDYSVEVYFNGATVLTKNFSIITTNG